MDKSLPRTGSKDSDMQGAQRNMSRHLVRRLYQSEVRGFSRYPACVFKCVFPFSPRLRVLLRRARLLVFHHHTTSGFYIATQKLKLEEEKNRLRDQSLFFTWGGSEDSGMEPA